MWFSCVIFAVISLPSLHSSCGVTQSLKTWPQPEFGRLGSFGVQFGFVNSEHFRAKVCPYLGVIEGSIFMKITFVFVKMTRPAFVSTETRLTKSQIHAKNKTFTEQCLSPSSILQLQRRRVIDNEIYHPCCSRRRYTTLRWTCVESSERDDLWFEKCNLRYI